VRVPKPTVRRTLGLILTLVGSWAAMVNPAAAQRRPAAEILPEETLIYFRIADMKEFLEIAGDSSMGRMMSDPEVAPLVDNLWGMATDEFEQVRDQVGLSLDELAQLPQGEVCFALVRNKNAGDLPFSPVLLIDVGDSADLAEVLQGKGEAMLEERGTNREEEDYDGTQLKIINPNFPDERMVYFVRDNTYGFTNDPEIAKSILTRWNVAPNNRDDVFSNNRKFVTIMNRCRGTSDARPDMTFFIDPYGIFQATQTGVQGAVVLALSKSLGFDGFLGIGGSVITGVEGYESISHMHVLLANPRAGAVKMLAMQDGPIEPPSFVPADAINYITVNWDVESTYETFEELYNKTSQSETALADAVAQLDERLGVSLREDIIGNLTGRLHYIQWSVPPSRLNSQATIFAFEVKDSEAAEETIAKTIETREMTDRMTEDRHEGATIRIFPTGGRGNRVRVGVGSDGVTREFERIEDEEPAQEEEDPFERQNLRRPTPCMVVYDNHLIISDSIEAVKELLSTGAGRKDSLASNPEFQEMMQEIERQIGGPQAGAMIFSDPEKALKNFYDLAQDGRNRDRLREAGGENRFARRLDEILEETPLPPFEVLAKYMTAGGGVMTNDETGFHYFTFQRRAGE